MSVRFVGDVAIVNGTYVMSWKGEKGPVLEKGIFSHVFEHVHNQLALPELTTHGGCGREQRGSGRRSQSKAQRCRAADAHSLGLQGTRQHPAPTSAGQR